MSAVLRPGAWARTCRARVERRGTGRRIRASVVTAAAAQPVEYTVKLGDTLYQIAKKHDVSVKALADANGKTLGRFVPIVVNEKLVIPVAESAPQKSVAAQAKAAAAPAPTKPAPPPPPPASPTPAAAPIAAKADKPVPATPVLNEYDSGKTHTVGPGESLWEISDKNKVDLRALVELNGLRARKYILVGEVLKLPAPPPPTSITEHISFVLGSSLKKFQAAIPAGLPAVKLPAVPEKAQAASVAVLASALLAIIARSQWGKLSPLIKPFSDKVADMFAALGAGLATARMQALSLGWACCVWTLGAVTGIIADGATLVKWGADSVSESAAWVASSMRKLGGSAGAPSSPPSGFFNLGSKFPVMPLGRDAANTVSPPAGPGSEGAGPRRPRSPVGGGGAVAAAQVPPVSAESDAGGAAEQPAAAAAAAPAPTAAAAAPVGASNPIRRVAAAAPPSRPATVPAPAGSVPSFRTRRAATAETPVAAVPEAAEKPVAGAPAAAAPAADGIWVSAPAPPAAEHHGSHVKTATDAAAAPAKGDDPVVWVEVPASHTRGAPAPRTMSAAAAAAAGAHMEEAAATRGRSPAAQPPLRGAAVHPSSRVGRPSPLAARPPRPESSSPPPSRSSPPPTPNPPPSSAGGSANSARAGSSADAGPSVVLEGEVVTDYPDIPPAGLDAIAESLGNAAGSFRSTVMGGVTDTVFNTVSGADAVVAAAQAFSPLALIPEDRFRSAFFGNENAKTTREELFPGTVYAFLQEFALLGGDAGVRMVVVKLADGTLWVHAPIQLTTELAVMIGALGGEVSALVVPNNSPEHSCFLPQWATQFPKAAVFVAPGLQDKWRSSGTVNVTGILGDASPNLWEGQIDQAFLDDLLFKETVFFHRESGVLMTSDSCFCIDDAWLRKPESRVPFLLAQAGATAAGVYQKLGCPGFLRPTLERDMPRVQAWVDRVLGWDIQMVAPAHGVLVEDGYAAFARAFEFANPPK